MKKLIWLDDIRDPSIFTNWISNNAPEFINTNNVIWLKNYYEFINWIKINGVPTKICFDHDLGESSEKTGYDCAKWLANYCQRNSIKLPKWNIQSANPVGRKNIDTYLKNYIKHVEDD